MKKRHGLLKAVLMSCFFVIPVLALTSCSKEKIFYKLSSLDNCTLGYVEGAKIIKFTESSVRGAYRTNFKVRIQ